MANINIGGRLHSTATGNTVAGANEILDDSKGKKQSVINQETDAALAGKQETIEDLSTIRSGAAAGATAYQKPETGIPSTDMASAVQTSLGKADTAYQKPSGGVLKSDLASSVQTSLDKADTAIQPAEFNELEEEVGTIGNGAYEESWDGSSAPVVADIPAGVSVTYNSTSYTGTLAASASTVDKIYLVSDGNGNYDRYVTIENSGTYSWKKVGTTAIPLSDYATKTEVSQLEAEVTDIENNLSESEIIQTTPTEIIGVKITSVIVTDSNCTLYYVPVSVGDSIRVKTVTTSDYVRYGYTENIPAVWTSVTDYTAEGSGTIEKEFVSPIDGYLCVSILTSSLVSIVFFTPNNGIGPKVKNIPEIENKTLGILYEDSQATRTADRYVKYNDGTIAVAGSASTMEIYEFELDGDEICVDVVAGSIDTVPAIIAFYENGVYLKNESVQALAVAENRYIAPVPPNATKVIVSNRFGLVPTTKAYVGRMPRLKGQNQSSGAYTAPSVSIISTKPFCYHFSPVSLIGGEVGPESIDDISIASRLGFPYIEANVHQTQDGEFVCLHGVNGKFGALFGSTYENTDINSVTLASIKSNIRYNSPVAKYQTSVPTLAEFCATCKMLGIGLQLKATGSSYFDDAYQLANSIMGDNMIIDTPPISARESFKGTIVYWFNSASNTFEDIVQQAKNFGFPFVASIGPTVISALKSAERLSEFFDTMHSLGFMVGCAGVYQTEEELLELISMGVDFIGSGHQINPFSPDVVFDLNGDASQFGGTATISGGVCTMEQGETIIAGENNSVSLGCGELVIKFSGSINVNFGSIGERTLTSDGGEYVKLSDYFYKSPQKLLITAISASTITELVYKINKC